MPEIKSQITTGNLIQIGAMIVALSVGWAMLDARGQSSTKSIDDHEIRIRRIEIEMSNRLSRMETTLERIDGRMGE